MKDKSDMRQIEERCLRHGARTLDDKELLTLLIGNEVTAESLLTDCEESVKNLSNMSVESADHIIGCTRHRYAMIQAAMELGRRSLVDKKRSKVCDARSAAFLVAPKIGFLDHEECWVLFLNADNRQLACERISTGGDNSTVIDIKRIVRRALELRASAIILFHNHPSGNTKPGKSDCSQTEKLKNAVKFFDILLLDHIIIACDSYFSFSEEKTGNIFQGKMPSSHA